MADANANARNGVAVAGLVTSLAFFWSPAFIMRNIFDSKSSEGYPFLPYPMALLNCFVWTCYGSVQPDSTYVLTVNGVGMAVQAFYVGFYIWYSGEVSRRNALLVLFVVSACGGVVAGLGYLWMHAVFGFAGAISMGLMYASPLSITMRVIRTKNAEHLSVLMAGASFLNSAFWTAYAFLSTPFDLYIAVPNLVGFVLAMVQLGLYVYYTFIHEGDFVA